jgi:AbiV family abortive infection protein
MIAISEQTLLEGSWHAVVQAGRLLHSAVLLFDNGDASSALVLARFGREELGRSRLLRVCAGEVSAGQLYTPSEIAAKCDDYVEEYRAANELLERAYDAKRKSQPNDRHEARCDGLSVDLDEAGTSWHRPVDLSIEEARQQITDAANDYSGELDRLSHERPSDSLQPHLRGKEMHAARQQMAPFDVPAACWPNSAVVLPAIPRKQSRVRRLWRAISG